jgi:hypothetical protein
MGEDKTKEFLQNPNQSLPESQKSPSPESPKSPTQISQQPTPQPQQEQIKTEEALKPFITPINRTTCFIINRLITVTGEKYEVEVTEKDKIKDKDIEELGWGEAVVKVIDHYFPQLPVGHPLLGLATSGMMLAGVAWYKIEQVKARSKKDLSDKDQENRT